MRGNDTLSCHGVVCVVPQFPRPGVPPKLPLKPYEHTLGDIVLGTPQIKEDCESDGVELDSYLPVSQFPALLVYLFHEILHLTGKWVSFYLKNIICLKIVKVRFVYNVMIIVIILLLQNTGTIFFW